MKGKYTRTRGRRGFRRFKRRFYRKRYTKRTRTSLYRFTRYSDFGSVFINNINDTFGGLNFSLSDVPNSAEFTSLFDMYKINGVKITFIPQMTENISLGAVNNAYASSRFFSAIDYNDATAPVTVDELRQYQSAKWTPILKRHTRYIPKPKIIDSGGFTLSPWISTATPNANYFGIKYAIEAMASTGTTTMEYTVECKFYMSFRQVK